MAKRRPAYPSLIRKLAERALSFPRRIWGNLGRHPRHLALGYAIGATSTLYSVASLFASLEIDVGPLLALPFRQLFSDHVLPILAAPLEYLALEIEPPLEAALAVSSIGGAITANSQFRTRYRFVKHLFVRRESGARFDHDWSTPPTLPGPPEHTLLTRMGVFAAAALLAYTFVGLLSFAIFVPFGLWFFLRDVRYVLAFPAAALLYVCQHFLYPHERPGQDDYWGTRWFCAVYDRRERLDRFISRSYVDFWRVESVDPRERDWTAARDAVADGARVVASALWLSVAIFAVSCAVR